MPHPTGYPNPWPAGKPKPRAPLPERFTRVLTQAPDSARMTCPNCSSKLQDFTTDTLQIIVKKHSIRLFCHRCNFGKGYGIPMELAFTLAFRRKNSK